MCGTIGFDLSRLRDGPRLAGVEEAMALLNRASTELPRTPRLGNAQGYRVFWQTYRQLRWRDVVADGRSHVVVGRHPCAHVRLDGDPTIALRHFVLRAVRADAGLELRVLDLGAPVPLVLGDGEPTTSAATRGPLVARLGAHALCALPFDACRETDERGGPGAADREDELDPPEDLWSPASHVGAITNARAVRHAGVQPLERTDIRMLARSTHIETYRQPCGVPWAELRLEGERGKVRIQVSRDQLDGMVLVGRYDRCASGSLPVFGADVSRVHLGLMRRGEEIEVLDLGSSNGTFHLGRAVHRVLVRDCAELHLGAPSDRVEVSLIAQTVFRN